MGYKRDRTYKLKFADPDYAGLEVRCRPPSTRALLDLNRLTNLRPADDAEHEQRVADLYELFAQLLIDWNLEDEHDQPVPATVDGLFDQAFDFVTDIILAYIRAVSGVSDDLKEQSNSGDASLVASLPMEPLSESPPS